MAALQPNQLAVFRLAIGVTMASVCALLYDWELAFIAPVLVVNLLYGSQQPPGKKAALGLLLVMAICLFVGLMLSALIFSYPLPSLPLLVIALFYPYYLASLGRLPPFAMVMLLIGFTLIPLMSQESMLVATNVAKGLTFSALMALAFCYLSYVLFPPAAKPTADKPKPNTGLDHHIAARRGWLSTLIVLPPVVLAILFGWVSDALVIAFIAILSADPQLQNGVKAGAGLLIGNALGGILAMLLFQFIQLAPNIVFYAVLMGLFCLWMSDRIDRAVQRESPRAALYKMAFTTVLILIGPVLSNSGGEVDAKFYTRLGQIAIAALYIVGAFSLVADKLTPPERVSDTGKASLSADIR